MLNSLLVMVVFVVACEAPPEPEPEPAATVVKPEPFDLAGYCAQMCERTTSCSMEAAEASAALGGEKVEKVLREARAKSGELRGECERGCASTPVDEANRGAALRAKRCLREESCAALEKCLAET